MKYCIAVIFLALFVGCTPKTELLPETKNIKTLYEKPRDCVLLGKEIGHKTDDLAMSLLDLRESAVNDLKNKSLALEGDTLHILHMEKGWSFFWREYLIEAEVYKCK